MTTLLKLKVTPNSRHNQLLGWHGEWLKISVTATPEKGQANKAVRKILADLLDIPLSHIHLISGALHTHKTISIDNLDDCECRQRIEKLLK